MIKVSQQHFNRTVQALKETESQIARKPNAGFVADYRKHATCLSQLIDELVVSDSLSGGELIKSSELVFARMSALKDKM